MGAASLSKFLDSIREIELRNSRIRLPGSLTHISVEEEPVEGWPTATRYRIGVELGATMIVNDHPTCRIDARKMQAEQVRHTLAHEVYGDVKQRLRDAYPDLIELKHAATRDLRTWEAVQRLETTFRDLEALMRP
jgi:hypothetical protein